MAFVGMGFGLGVMAAVVAKAPMKLRRLMPLMGKCHISGLQVANSMEQVKNLNLIADFAKRQAALAAKNG